MKKRVLTKTQFQTFTMKKLGVLIETLNKICKLFKCNSGLGDLLEYIPDEGRMNQPMPDNNELINMFRTVIQEELKPVRQDLHELRNDVQELKKGQAAIETAVNDLRAINR